PRWDLTARLKIFYSEAICAEIRSYSALAELEERLPQSYASWAPFNQAEYLEAMFLLPGYILSSQGDRMAMAHSVEGRFPFLDHRVVQLAALIPPNLKMKVLNEKYILKRCAEHLIPRSVEKRPKQPYRAPEGNSFLFGVEDSQFSDDDSFLEKGLIDSTGVLELVAFIEEQYGIRFQDDEIIPENLDSVNKLIQFLNKKLVPAA